jgi:hypothetical protein
VECHFGTFKADEGGVLSVEWGTNKGPDFQSCPSCDPFLMCRPKCKYICFV